MDDRAGSSELSRDCFVGPCVLLDDDAMVILRTRRWCQEDVFRSGAAIWLGQGLRDKPHFAQHARSTRSMAGCRADWRRTYCDKSGRISMYFQCVSHGLAFGRHFAYFQKISPYLPALPRTHGRPRDSFSAGPQNPEESHPPCNAMRHTSACLSCACLWLGSLLWGEY
jgi:hypothetical protein